MINDEDFDPLAEPKTESESGRPTSRLETIVQTAKLASHLRRAFKNPTIPPAIAQAVDVELSHCISRLPARLQLTSDEQLTPGETHAVMYLQDIRLLLHRHNLNPSCSTEVRQSGINECLSVARNTARVLSRVISYPQPDGNDSVPVGPTSTRNAAKWEEDMRVSSSTFTCLHVWRCMLFLTACDDFEGALICATASKAIGRARAINSACGRYYEFFLNFCVDRRRRTLQPLEEDEELVAYLSADLQGNLDQAWIWQGASEPAQVACESRFGNAQVDGEDEAEWNDWSKVVRELKRLLEGRKARASPQQQTSHSSDGLHLAPRADAASSPSQQPSPSNRMSIAGLI